MRSHYLLERLKLKRLIILSIGKERAELALSYTARMQNGTAASDKLFWVSYKGKHTLIIQLHSSTSTQGNDNVCLHYFYINVYSHAIQNNSKMEKKNFHQNVNYKWYAHTMECYSAIKRNKLIFIIDISQKC